MPFFQASLFPQASLLLAELDQAQSKTCAPRHHSRPQSFTPRFDVSETTEAFELYGELPGIEQEDISINFTDAQTLQITGKTQRNVSTVPAAAATAETTQTEAAQEASTEESHKATVEDEYDEADTPLATPATSTTAAPSATENVAAEQQQEQRRKYWVAERRVGTFAREFSFSKRIEQDGVQASLKNGILRVTVPKSQKSAKVQVKVL